VTLWLERVDVSNVVESMVGSDGDAGVGAPVRVVLRRSRRGGATCSRWSGIAHEVRPADVDESVRPGEAPDAYVRRLAADKARAVADALGDPHAAVVAADTTVVIDGEILGKPGRRAEARAMVRRLGRAHARGVHRHGAVRGPRAADASSGVGVTFRALGDAEIAGYVATGEPMDKAGAYGIQGYGATIVERVDGDYFAGAWGCRWCAPWRC
jgi:septum formation protein